jgi:hypothetical protein
MSQAKFDIVRSQIEQMADDAGKAFTIAIRDGAPMSAQDALNRLKAIQSIAFDASLMMGLAGLIRDDVGEEKADAEAAD